MLFMVVEKLKNQDGKAVYRKLRKGRGLPDGLTFVAKVLQADRAMQAAVENHQREVRRRVLTEGEAAVVQRRHLHGRYGLTRHQ